MKHYEVGSVQFDGKTYFLIRRTEDTSICVIPTKYLKHKTKANCSPNTVERSARALSYFMEYMWERKLQFEAVYDLAYSRQMELFQQFLLFQSFLLLPFFYIFYLVNKKVVLSYRR